MHANVRATIENVAGQLECEFALTESEGGPDLYNAEDAVDYRDWMAYGELPYYIHRTPHLWLQALRGQEGLVDEASADAIEFLAAPVRLKAKTPDEKYVCEALSSRLEMMFVLMCLSPMFTNANCSWLVRYRRS